MTGPQGTPLLSIEGLSLWYGAVQALWHIDLRIDEGECVAVIGANGAGKSSLVNAIAGVGRPRSGRIRLAGLDIESLQPSRVSALGIAIVPERRRLFPSLSIEENILVGAQVGRPGPWTLKKIYDLFPELVPIRSLGGHLVSGGQQQMAAIARALMANPRLLLCDEISLGLAPIIVARFYSMFPALRASGISILVVEQETRRALGACDRFYCLLDGKVSLSGRPLEVTEDAVNQSYFGIG
ncbi:ABC transporter ATP-binding protein [Bradyrhizobium sp. SSBR45G]|uniref:ABC transporter ATP-binding protein n=1 Tax=unclassified Bradyrhizobium TaxID=2631580 RepID=UPI002342B53C|nr:MULTISPECIES: ABC transporter ATP-binding protein [unclassified Bradyrhizobium]GLH76654.1 ABC transporter ATP-binding protein [Bradyrhizobium sp. SSBR45G]GLH84267.1 ABC transporter ATP-binding protein [Bradyrhizobium sp. SSBR45R]